MLMVQAIDTGDAGVIGGKVVVVVVIGKGGGRGHQC